MDIQDSRRLARTASEESLLGPISDIERLFDDMEGQVSGQASFRRQVSAKPSALKSNQNSGYTTPRKKRKTVHFDLGSASTDTSHKKRL